MVNKRSKITQGFRSYESIAQGVYLERTMTAKTELIAELILFNTT